MAYHYRLSDGCSMPPLSRECVVQGIRIINVRVGTKLNSYREHHLHAHYLFARNKQRREFATLFSDHVTMISTYDMAKIKVGPPAVSRYHQIQRLFPTSYSPNYSDHDFPVPNYLLSVSAYLVLQDADVDMNDVSEIAQNLSNASTYDYTPVASVTQSKNSVLEKFNILMDESVNDLYEIIISQAKTQLNVKTSKEEILDAFIEEEKGIQVEYPDSRAQLEAILQTRVVLLNVTDNTSVNIATDNCHNEEAPIYICMKNEPLAFALPVFCKESIEKFSSLSINPGSLTFDNLGRLHLNTPYSGPSHVYIRSSKYNGITAVSHITDIHKIICADKMLKNKSVLMIMADGGPDFTPISVLNSLYFYRLFKTLKLDILSVFTYAARYSAFNCIEHLWSPLSNKLSGV